MNTQLEVKRGRVHTWDGRWLNRTQVLLEAAEVLKAAPEAYEQSYPYRPICGTQGCIAGAVSVVIAGTEGHPHDTHAFTDLSKFFRPRQRSDDWIWLFKGSWKGTPERQRCQTAYEKAMDSKDAPGRVKAAVKAIKLFIAGMGGKAK